MVYEYKDDRKWEHLMKFADDYRFCSIEVVMAQKYILKNSEN